MWYKVDWDRLVLLLLPTFLRKPILFGFLRALISPIASLHYTWSRMRDSNLNKLSYNGQRCYLRKALNDKCDPNLRRIYIGETGQTQPDYIYTQEEYLDVYLGIMYIDAEFNYTSSTIDFLVFVPAELLASKINELTALLDFYKLAGKSYQMVAI